MPDILQPGFNPEGIPHQPRSTDFQWHDLGSALPPFDWNEGYDIEVELAKKLNQPGFLIPVKHQWQSGSCGGQATSAANEVIEADATGTFEESSAKGVIAQTFVLGPNGEMVGSRMSDNGDLLVKKGCPREAALPSYPSNGDPVTDAFMNRPQDITPAVLEDALCRERQGPTPM